MFDLDPREVRRDRLATAVGRTVVLMRFNLGVVPLINLMSEVLFTASYIHMDETPLQALHSGKAVGAEHYIVVRAGGPPGRPIILYDYIASRTKAALKQLLIGAEGPYRGKLISDGLERYDEIAAEMNLLHFGCLQHCRSMFFKARKVSQLPSKPHVRKRCDRNVYPSGLPS